MAKHGRGSTGINIATSNVQRRSLNMANNESLSNQRGKATSQSATAAARNLFNRTAAQGGTRGTAASAGDYSRLTGSGTRGPGTGQAPTIAGPDGLR
jgi:hypothetical protein